MVETICQKCESGPLQFPDSSDGVVHLGETYNHMKMGDKLTAFLFVTDCGLNYISRDFNDSPLSKPNGKKSKGALPSQRK